MHQGLVVVQRYSLNQSDPVSLGLRGITPRGSRGIGSLLASYRGFEGIPWPKTPATLTTVEGFASIEQIGEIRPYVDNLRKIARCDLLYCCRLTGLMSCDAPPSGFIRLGFDAGSYYGDDNCFSAVFQDILFGKFEELTQFDRQLNDNLLFSSLTEANEFLRRRAILLAEGLPIETDDNEFTVIEVAVEAENSLSV